MNYLIFSLCPLIIYFTLRWLSPWLTSIASAKVNERSAHQGVVPQGAGGVIFVLFFAVSLIFGDYKLASLCLLLSVIGFLDDVYGLSVFVRLILQAIISLLAAFILNDTALVFIIFMLLLANINLTNFMDGMDFLSITQVLAITIGISIAAYLKLAPAEMLIIMPLIAACFMGFAPFNFPKARMFLGDSGSLPMGLLLGYALVSYGLQSGVIPAVILSGYYLCDSGITLTKRILRGEKFWQGHKQHYYQQAMQKGISVKRILAYITLLNTALVILSLFSAFYPHYQLLGFTAAMALIATTLYLFSNEIVP